MQARPACAPGLWPMGGSERAAQRAARDGLLSVRNGLTSILTRGALRG